VNGPLTDCHPGAVRRYVWTVEAREPGRSGSTLAALTGHVGDRTPVGCRRQRQGLSRCLWRSQRAVSVGDGQLVGCSVGLVSGDERSLSRAESQERIRAIRRRLRMGTGDARRAVDVDPGALGPKNEGAGSAEMEPWVLAVKYAMELAAHRETGAALLAEKDRTIAKLEELVEELRRRSVASVERSDVAE